MKNYISPIFRAKDFESVEQLQEQEKYIARIVAQAGMFNDFADAIFNHK